MVRKKEEKVLIRPPQTYEMEFIESLFYIHPKTPPDGANMYNK
jgi:hypothetical protein